MLENGQRSSPEGMAHGSGLPAMEEDMRGSDEGDAWRLLDAMEEELWLWDTAEKGCAP